MEKLIKIQSELKAPKNQFNSFGKYKYRSAEDILEAVKPLLKKYGCYLTITETTQEIAGYLVLTSKVSTSLLNSITFGFPHLTQTNSGHPALIGVSQSSSG